MTKSPNWPLLAFLLAFTACAVLLAVEFMIQGFQIKNITDGVINTGITLIGYAIFHASLKASRSAKTHTLHTLNFIALIAIILWLVFGNLLAVLIAIVFRNGVVGNWQF